MFPAVAMPEMVRAKRVMRLSYRLSAHFVGKVGKIAQFGEVIRPLHKTQLYRTLLNMIPLPLRRFGSHLRLLHLLLSQICWFGETLTTKAVSETANLKVHFPRWLGIMLG